MSRTKINLEKFIKTKKNEKYSYISKLLRIQHYETNPLAFNTKKTQLQQK